MAMKDTVADSWATRYAAAERAKAKAKAKLKNKLDLFYLCLHRTPGDVRARVESGTASPAEGVLDELDTRARSLCKAPKWLQALAVMEEALSLRVQQYGGNSDEVRDSCTAAGKLCNVLALFFLEKDNFDMSLALLGKAEILR